MRHRIVVHLNRYADSVWRQQLKFVISQMRGVDFVVIEEVEEEAPPEPRQCKRRLCWLQTAPDEPTNHKYRKPLWLPEGMTPGTDYATRAPWLDEPE